MLAEDEKRTFGDSQERLTRPPVDEHRPGGVNEKPIKPVEEETPPAEGEKGAPKSDNELSPSQSDSEAALNDRELYTNWQFLTVFISISFGFHAAFLGTVNSWNGGQVLLPVTLLLRRMYNLLTPLNLLMISAGLNVTSVSDGLDLAGIASGVNTTQIESNLFTNELFWGVVHSDPSQFASGFNSTGIAHGLHMGEILPAINVTQIASGLQLGNLISGLNVTNFFPAAYNEFPAGIQEMRIALWFYPTLIFTQTLSSVFFGRLSDYVGRRWIFLFGNAVSVAAFLATGRSDEGTTMTGLSALIGVGTGIQILGPWLALAELVPVRRRFTVTGLCLCLLGPLIVLHVAIATAFVKNTEQGWRWNYYINGILSFVSLVGLFIAYHPPTYHQLHNHPVDDPPVKDWLGLVAFTAAVAMITYSLGWGKFIYVWSSPQIIAVITLSGFSLVAFLIYEFNFGNDRNAYPAYLLRSLTHVSQMALAGVHTLIWWFAPIAQLVIFLTITPRFGMKAAWENLWAAGLVGGFFFASLALIKPKYLKWHIALGATFEMVFLATLRALVRTDQYRLSMAFFFLSGLGLGYVTVITYVTAPMTAHHRELGLCVGLVSSYRNLIFAVIRAVFLTLYVNQIKAKIWGSFLPAFGKAGPIPDSIRSILGGLSEVQETGKIDELLDLPILKTMTDSLMTVFSQSWQFVICLAYIYFFIVLIYSVFAPDTDSYLSDRIFVRLNRLSALRFPGQRRKE